MTMGAKGRIVTVPPPPPTTQLHDTSVDDNIKVNGILNVRSSVNLPPDIHCSR